MVSLEWRSCFTNQSTVILQAYQRFEKAVLGHGELTLSFMLLA
jgi:hypothetical protein